MALNSRSIGQPITGSSDGSPEMIVRNTFITLEDPDSAAQRRSRRLKTLPATSSPNADTLSPDQATMSGPPSFWRSVASTTAPSTMTTSVGPTAIPSTGPQASRPLKAAPLPRQALAQQPQRTILSSLGPNAVSASPRVVTSPSLSSRVPSVPALPQSVSAPTRLTLRSLEVDKQQIRQPASVASSSVSPLLKDKSPSYITRSIGSLALSPRGATRSLGSQAIASIGPSCFLPSPTTSVGQTGFSATASLGQAWFSPTPFDTVEQDYFSRLPKAPTAAVLPSGAIDSVKAGIMMRPTSQSPPLNLVHTSSGLTTSPFVVRNTFIEMEDPENPKIKRSERRLKTMPPSVTSPSMVDESDEALMCGAVSMPLGEMSKEVTRLRMPPASIVPTLSMGTTFREHEPAIVNPSVSQYFPTFSMGPQQMMQFTQPSMLSFPLTHPAGQLTQAVPAGPPGVFTSAVNPVAVPAIGSSNMQPMMAKVITSTSVDGRSLLGNVWALSQDPQGCRQVQAAFDNSNEDVCLALALELQGHINEALHNPHANFVLRKIVEKLSAPSLQFVVDELVRAGPSAICEASRHRYGCRIVESLFETCPSSQLQPMVSPLLADISGLCSHMYANFVMQKMLAHGTDEQKNLILDTLHRDVGTLGTNFYASAVYGTAFRTAPVEDKALLAGTLTSNPNVMVALNRFKHGPEIVKVCLEHADESTSQAIRAQLETAALQRQQAAATSGTAQPKMAKVLSIGDKKQRRSSGGAHAHNPSMARVYSAH